MSTVNQNHETKFLVTVDTETYAIPGVPALFDANIYGSVNGDRFGIPKIIDLCDRYGAKATFFVDVYMHYACGKPLVEEACQLICRKGHSVELHAHTSWLPDHRSEHLRGYPLERQAEIIGEGKELISSWVGRPPVAFRAGAYAANLDTLRALEQNGFRVDSSYFIFHRNCELSAQLQNRYANSVFKIGHIIEVPVTAYWLVNTGPYKKVSKVDINACSLAEMREIIPKLVRSGTRYIVLFLHSFSFIRFRKGYTRFVPNVRAISRFESVLKMVSEEGYGFCTIEEAANDSAGPQLTSLDRMPHLSPLRVLPRAWQRIVE